MTTITMDLVNLSPSLPVSDVPLGNEDADVKFEGSDNKNLSQVLRLHKTKAEDRANKWCASQINCLWLIFIHFQPSITKKP